nr:PREDICTED: uncharacterized protein LOC102353795 [Latimeria chalumnae]|eukprot:XP_005995976.1 PREDICTED: uncharacterized protein LOC102353795 [Latimeria chalumnae]
MRPSPRLILAKKLPTIWEAYEEILQNINNGPDCSKKGHVKSSSPSAEDYLDSICQLAKPTLFIPQDNTSTIRDSPTLNFRQDQWLLKLPPVQRLTPNNSHRVNKTRGLTNKHLEKAKENSLHFGIDPLQQLYGQVEALDQDQAENHNLRSVSRDRLKSKGHIITKPSHRNAGSTSAYTVTNKRTMIQNWISECKRVWKEAKITTCLLPSL